MNVVCLVGRITETPELRCTTTGNSVCVFSVAVDRDYKEKDGSYGSDFFRVVAYKSRAEYIGKYVKKGALLEITGRLHLNKYEKDGKKLSVVEIIADKVKNRSPKRSGAEVTADDFDEVEPMDVIPF